MQTEFTGMIKSAGDICRKNQGAGSICGRDQGAGSIWGGGIGVQAESTGVTRGTGSICKRMGAGDWRCRRHLQEGLWGRQGLQE